ncbi:hypothetical protein EYF80_024296 [Liparis tanakae]|uniref:Uncharacterized protein n=1 Tax=Liparis tanakae TaxID=230148 RepID=A0A4Z2HI10_9TELE|nr:hypothetical protein EYF80_024296 [Liparis tanakae]
MHQHTPEEKYSCAELAQDMKMGPTSTTDAYTQFRHTRPVNLTEARVPIPIPSPRLLLGGATRQNAAHASRRASRLQWS